MHVVEDGEAAVDFLRREGSTPRPPVPTSCSSTSTCRASTDGRCSPASSPIPVSGAIPVVVLSTSKSVEDVRSSYELHANAFVTKPAELDRFLDVVRQVGDFFLTVVPPAQPPTEPSTATGCRARPTAR